MSAELSRRNFIATAALGAAGLAAAGTASASEQAEPGYGKGNMPDQWDEEYDVVVVGAGGGGCAAAIGAARAGAKTLVLESQGSTIATSTAVCGGYLMIVGSDEQKDAGIEDSAEQFVEDTMAWGETCREDVCQSFADHCLDYYQLVKEMGVAFVTTDVVASPGCSIPRTLTVDPHDHQAKLQETAEASGATIMFKTEGGRLYVNGNGEVAGIQAKTEDGKEIAIKAKKAVILASGGFTHNAELLNECLPGLGDIKAFSSVGHTGQGHYAAAEVGAKLEGRPYIYAVEGMAPDSLTMDGYAELYIYGAIKVNTEGDRYVNEGLYWCNDMTRALLQQPMKDGQYFNWQIIDQNGYDKAKAAGRPLGVYDTNESLFTKGETIEELAEAIGAPDLPETLAKYNEDIAAGKDTMFGRETLCGDGTGDPVALDTPPYYAFPNVPWLAYDPATSFIADGECHILDQYGEPIPRLYGAGEITARSIVGNHYQYGLAVGSACTFGLYAGTQVAALDAWDE